jgi:uncharacterized protein with PIN domain
MGYDCRSANDLPPGNPREDTDILKIAGEEKRIILTQDAELARRGEGNAIRLVSSDLAAQIRQLVQAGLIHPEIRLTRCSRCNALLQEGTSPEKPNTQFQKIFHLYIVQSVTGSTGKEHIQKI